MTSPGRRPARAAGERGATCGTRTPPAVPAGRPAGSRRASSAAFSRVSCSILMPMYGRATRPHASSCAPATPPQRRAGAAAVGRPPEPALRLPGAPGRHARRHRPRIDSDAKLPSLTAPGEPGSAGTPSSLTQAGQGRPQPGSPAAGKAATLRRGGRGGDLVDDGLRGVDRDRERDAVRADRQQRRDAHHLRVAVRVGARTRRGAQHAPLHPSHGHAATQRLARAACVFLSGPARPGSRAPPHAAPCMTAARGRRPARARAPRPPD